ncbi:type II secretion system protein [Fontivita pretiosa]|uniref:type II secretion system protein n=1 Tax=Fontivita pretiosa TaxID=2989684 RepID=UPI003D166E3C
MRRCRVRFPSAFAPAFTLVELLVVIGIIALLISVLLPALASARQTANDVKCASNIRQLVTALTMYATSNRGKYPPNLNSGAMYPAPPPGQPTANLWYDADRIGQFLPKTVQYTSGSIGGNVFICPNDEGAARSYAMNVWASSVADQFVLNTATNGWVYNPDAGANLAAADRGTMWSSQTRGGSELILLTEKYSANGASGTYAAGATVGYQGSTAGIRFVGNLSLGMGRFGTVATEIDWSRHRRKDDRARFASEARGRINIGFADGHVAMFRADDLADRATGKSRLVALWSPFDRALP